MVVVFVVDYRTQFPGMFVIFISHQWLGAKSCDPKGQQLLVLRQALEAFIDGTMKVEVDMMRTFGDPLDTWSVLLGQWPTGFKRLWGFHI